VLEYQVAVWDFSEFIGKVLPGEVQLLVQTGLPPGAVVNVVTTPRRTAKMCVPRSPVLRRSFRVVTSRSGISMI
jgi:hypothetical protein